MKVIERAAELQAGGCPVCLAIGFFDGVHLGHQQVIRQAVSDAAQHEGLAVALTFDRHPKAIVAPDRVPPLIYSLDQKLRALASLGVDATLLLHFDAHFSQQPGEAFVRQLVSEFGRVDSICVGSTFSFGHRRSGNVELLRRLGQELRFTVHGLAAVALDGQPVSSTRIREAIATGQLDQASQLLGRPYAFAGRVVHGDRLGRQLGFPTANLEVTGRAVPPVGVYAAHAEVLGKTHRAVVNIGYRPTLKNPTPELRLEAHLLNFNAELEGKELEVTFVEKLRDEQKFPTLDALREQISRDIAAALRLFRADPRV